MSDYFMNMYDEEKPQDPRLDVDGYYVNTDTIVVPDNFTVRVKIYKVVVLGIVLLITIVSMIYLNMLAKGFQNPEVNKYMLMSKFFLWAMVLIYVYFIISYSGKRVVVFGRSLTLTRFYVSSDTISVNDIQKCEVITGLSSHSRYHTTHYSKLVIYYNYKYKFEMTDIIFKDWQKLVNYLDSTGKVSYIDGRSNLSRALDDMFHH